VGWKRQPVQIVFVLEVSVDAWLAVVGRVETPRPRVCPACGHGRVTFDGWYARETRRGRVWIHRVRCADEGCSQRGHSLLPDVLVSGRADLASVIGWGLEARAAGMGRRGIAARLGVPEGTVRGWLRAVAVGGGQVAGRLLAAAAAAAPGVRDPPPGSPVEVLVATARLAAASLALLSGEPVDVWRHAVMVCGGRLLS
jgi:hypothetical protein